MAELAREEMEQLQQQIEEQGEQLKFLLLPKDPLDEKNIMLEVGKPLQGVGWVGQQREQSQSSCLAEEAQAGPNIELADLHVCCSYGGRCKACCTAWASELQAPAVRAGTGRHRRRGGSAVGG